MATMTRSKSQLIRGFLPGQTFQHQNENVVRVSWLTTSRAEVNANLLLESLEERLGRWQVVDGDGPPVNRAPGFLRPVLDHADEYALLEPDGEVFYNVWPLVFRCTNPECLKVAIFDKPEEWRNAKGSPERCDRCRWPREQFEYMVVHTCGRDAPMPVPSCEVKDGDGRAHGYRYVYLQDTGSFETATWRCRYGSCNGRRISGMRYRPCSCGDGGYQHVTVRQERRFITQTFAFVSFDPTPMVRLQGAAGSEKVVVGSYLEFFDKDYERALGDVSKDRVDAEAKWRTMKAALEATDTPPGEIADMRKMVLGESGDAFEEISNLVGDEAVVGAAGGSPRARERTLIWGEAGELKTWRLETFRKVALDTGRPGAAAVIEDADRKLREFGFSDVLVVENFPVALVAYGYTRLGRSPEHVILRPFSPLKKGKYRDKTPIYVSPTKTEAVFFELDAERVSSWLADNGAMEAIDLPHGDPLLRRRAAKAAMLRAYHSDEEVRRLVFLLEHTVAHALIKNLGERSGFSEETMAEYLIPEMLTIGLYADTHQEFTLGALVSLVEHRLGDWLDAAREGVEGCSWDPQCGIDDGACMACLHLAFGCGEFNEKLDRAVLIGSPAGHEQVLDVDRGYWM